MYSRRLGFLAVILCVSILLPAESTVGQEIDEAASAIARIVERLSTLKEKSGAYAAA